MSHPFERMIKTEIDSANDHLPQQRKSLSVLLSESVPKYTMKNGEASVILKDELERLAALVPSRYHGSFLIPIVILRRMDLGPGIYTVTGAKPELFLVHRIVGQHSLDWDSFNDWFPNHRLARPHIQVLRKIFPSVTCIGFTAGSQETEQ